MKKNLLNIFTVAIIAVICSLASCKKESSQKIGSSLMEKTNQKSNIPDSMVLTPEGLMPKSHVHLIENGYHLEIRSSHMVKVETATGIQKEDFGPIQAPAINQKNTPQNPVGSNFKSERSIILPSGNGWQTWSEWHNVASEPINYFSSTWAVPGPPGTNDGQILFIWDGFEPYQVEANNPNNLVIQPVLQWGYNNLIGGQYWCISNWCVWGNNQSAYTTPVNNLTAGTSLQGIVTYTGNQSGSYNYTSSFYNYSNSMNVIQNADNYHNTSPIPFIPVENWAYEVLESDFATRSTDYPSELSVNMTQISMQTGPPGVYTPAALSWTPVISSFATLGEHTYVVSSDPNGTVGQVQLFFHPEAPPSISYTTPDVYYPNNAITPLNPNNTGGPAAYSVSPALPYGISLNASTGVISGTPGAASSAANYVVTATNSAGSSHFTINITVNAAVPISFNVSSNNTHITDFDLVVNGENQSGPRGVSQSNPIVIAGDGGPTNSTVVMQVTFGYMPVNASIYPPGAAPVNGVINGGNVTFNNVNLSTSGTAYIVIN